MFEGYQDRKSNGLSVKIDWFSFTIIDESYTPELIISMLGYTYGDFRSISHGINGYLSQLRHVSYPISIQYNGQEGMGIHVDISGSAVADVVSHYRKKHTSITPFGTPAFDTDDFSYTVFANLINEVNNHGHVTRFDLAIDDIGTAFFSLPELSSILSSGNYVSKFRKWKELIKYQDGNKYCGYTIYLGSRSSDVMLRVYDKQLEQNEKLLACGERPIEQTWVRWELELKGERAKAACNLIMQGVSIGNITIGVLSNYLRLINSDSTRKSRCSTMEKWLTFLDGVSRISLYMPKEPRTINKVKNWLMRQVAPCLATIIISEYGDSNFIHTLLESGERRLRRQHFELIDQALSAA